MAMSSEDTPIYVLSRMSGLDDAIRNLAPKILERELTVETVPFYDSNDYLDDAGYAVIQDAQIVVIDPVFLMYNYSIMHSLDWAHCTTCGVETLFMAILNEPRFKVTRHGGEKFYNLMAEYVMTNVLSWERNLQHLLQHHGKKIWFRNIKEAAKFRTLDELTITILGVGSMGQAIARFFKHRGSKLYGFTRTGKHYEALSLFNKINCHLTEDLLEDTDYIINALPRTIHTVDILGGKTLSCCKKKPIFISVTRGNIISDEDLADALKYGWIGGAVLDIVDSSSLSDDSCLWDFDDVIITPNCATVYKTEQVAENFLRSLICYEQNMMLPGLLDWDAGY